MDPDINCNVGGEQNVLWFGQRSTAEAVWGNWEAHQFTWEAVVTVLSCSQSSWLVKVHSSFVQ